MKFAAFIGIFLLLSVVSIDAQSSYDKERLLAARKRDETKEERLKAKAKLPPEAALQSSDVEVFPTKTMTWGKGLFDGLAKITVKKKVGYIDASGKVIIKPQFKDAGHFSDGLAPFEADSGKWGFINKKGQIEIKPQFDWALSFSEGLALVQSGKNWGFIDKTGAFVIEPLYGEAESFSEGFAAVSVYNKEYEWQANSNLEGKWEWFFIDRSGKNIFGTVFDDISRSFNKGMAIVSKRKDNNINAFSESFVIDNRGSVLWPLDTWYTTWFSDDVIIVAAKDEKNNNYFSFRDRSGKLLTEKRFRYVSSFSEGLAPALLDEKYGYIDKSGDFVIKPDFESANTFTGGLASVKTADGKKGFIDRSGSIIFETKCDWNGYFSGGIALVAGCGKEKFSEETGYIDKTGKFIWNPTK